MVPFCCLFYFDLLNGSFFIMAYLNGSFFVMAHLNRSLCLSWHVSFVTVMGYKSQSALWLNFFKCYLGIKLFCCNLNGISVEMTCPQSCRKTGVRVVMQNLFSTPHPPFTPISPQVWGTCSPSTAAFWFWERILMLAHLFAFWIWGTVPRLLDCFQFKKKKLFEKDYARLFPVPAQKCYW